jgi:hypothetical protein
MLFNELLEASCMYRGRGPLVMGDVEGQAQGIEHRQNEAKLGCGFAGLELVDPLAGDASTRRKLGLAEAEIPATAADRCGQIPDRLYSHSGC